MSTCPHWNAWPANVASVTAGSGWYAISIDNCVRSSRGPCSVSAVVKRTVSFGLSTQSYNRRYFLSSRYFRRGQLFLEYADSDRLLMYYAAICSTSNMTLVIIYVYHLYIIIRHKGMKPLESRQPSPLQSAVYGNSPLNSSFS